MSMESLVLDNIGNVLTLFNSLSYHRFISFADMFKELAFGFMDFFFFFFNVYFLLRERDRETERERERMSGGEAEREWGNRES